MPASGTDRGGKCAADQQGTPRSPPRFQADARASGILDRRPRFAQAASAPRSPASVARAPMVAYGAGFMRRSRAASILPILSLLACALGAPPARAAWHTLEEIPVESPVYRLVEDLAATYSLSSGLLTTRPWTRAELGHFLDQLVADVPAAAKDVAVARLRRELEPRGGLEGLEPAWSSDQKDASFELSPYARVGYAEDRSRHTVVRDERIGLQGSLAFGENALLFADGYAGTVTPGAHGTPNADGSLADPRSRLTAWYDRAYATWASRAFSFRAGRTWLRWGPGSSGTLGLSDAAPAFDLLEGRARFGDGAQLAWFVGSLDPARETYLAGHRVEVRAGPSVELAFAELARFDGAGNAPVYLVPVIPYALVERRLRAANEVPRDSVERERNSNVMYTADFSWSRRPGVRIYAEVMVDDATLHNTRPLAMGWQVGAHVRRLRPRGALSARGEYSRVYPYTYSVASGHDFSHGGFPTGYALGPDADQWWGRLEWRSGPDWSWGLEGSLIRKGAQRLGEAWQPGTPVPTRLTLRFPVDDDQRLALTADWSPSPSWTLSAAAGSANGNSRGNIYRNDGSGVFGSGRATIRW